MPRRRHAAPSEPVTWKRIQTERKCSFCKTKLTLEQVRQFGTTYQEGRAVRFVKCRACFDQ